VGDNHLIRGLIFFFACVAVLAVPARADDWPQWRGPNVDGISKETGWNAKDLKSAWEAQLGPGCSTVSVVGDRVYSMGYDERANQDVIYCLDAKSGKEVWHYGYRAEMWNKQHDGGPGSTPCVIKGFVYTVSREAVVTCVDAANGQFKWSKDFRREMNLKVPNWGFTGSVISDGDLVYVDLGAIIAMEPGKNTTKWVTRNFGTAYATPIPFKLGSAKALATFPETGLVVIDRNNGNPVATHAWQTRYGVNATTPVIVGNSGIFISSGYNTGCLMLNLTNKGLDEVWGGKQMSTHMSTAIYHAGHLYGFDESVLECLDAKTGERKWNQRGLGKGSLTMVDDKLIVLGDNGELKIAPVSPAGFNPISSTQTVSGTTWIMPVLANKRLYAKNNKGHLMCFEAGQ